MFTGALAGLRGPAIIFGCSAILCMPANCQEERPQTYNGNGFVTFGIGACQHGVANASVAGGGDVFVWRGLSVGGEIGYYSFIEQGRFRFGLATVNAGYHFVNRRRPGRFEPFVTAGVPGIAFSGGSVPAASLGGGLNYWFSRKAGLRTEFRAYGVEGEGLAMFRIGVVFR